jgi:membrane-bound lytic murein transglycosylase B
LRFIIRFFSLLLLSSISAHALDFTKKKEVKSFIKMMKKEFNYDEKYLFRLFSNIKKEPKSKIKTTKKLEDKKTSDKKTSDKKISKKRRPQGSWDIYERIHLKQNQTNLGVEFMHKHKQIFEKAQKKYGIPPEYITAIIGIESYYGKNRGVYYVLDALAHQAFGNNRRKKFYQYELQEFLRMCYREQIEPRRVKGSKAGAIGLAQFMPSNYKSLAVDFNNDGKIRISNPTDAIGSVANYFRESGWRQNEPIGTRVNYKGDRFYGLKTGTKYRYQRKNLKNITPKRYFPYTKKVMLIKLEREKYDELWYGTHNFYVITRYNHSSYYAMAVHQLAEEIKRSYLKKYGKKRKSRLYLATN